MDALRSGHDAAGQALAFNLTDSLVRKLVNGQGYSAMTKRFGGEFGEMSLAAMRLDAAILPFVASLVEWSPLSAKPEPVELSRHVSAHHASTRQYTRPNALLAVLLSSSVVRAVDDWVSRR